MAASDQYKGRLGTVARGPCVRRSQTRLCKQYILVLYDLVSSDGQSLISGVPREKGHAKIQPSRHQGREFDYLLASICTSRMTAEARLSVCAFPGEDPALACLVGCDDFFLLIIRDMRVENLKDLLSLELRTPSSELGRLRQTFEAVKLRAVYRCRVGA